MLLGNRLNRTHTLGNRSNLFRTIGSYITPDNIDRTVKLAIAAHQAYSDIEKYKRKKHD